MNKPKVILLNPHMTSASGPQLLRGYSGKIYGTTRWTAGYHCHTVEMTLEEYEACWQDLHAAIQLCMRGWFPKFLLPERPAACVDFETGYDLGLEGRDLPEQASAATRSGWQAAQVDAGTQPQPSASRSQRRREKPRTKNQEP